MISIYESEVDLLIAKVVRFETGKPIGRLLKSQNLRKFRIVARNSGLRHERGDMMKM